MFYEILIFVPFFREWNKNTVRKKITFVNLFLDLLGVINKLKAVVHLILL